jgi:hypothetical protein
MTISNGVIRTILKNNERIKDFNFYGNSSAIEFISQKEIFIKG